MNAEEAIIKKLCMECSRRMNTCKEYPPSYTDAYKCKWDEAQWEFKKMDEAFVATTNKEKE